MNLSNEQQSAWDTLIEAAADLQQAGTPPGPAEAVAAVTYPLDDDVRKAVDRFKDAACKVQELDEASHNNENP